MAARKKLTDSSILRSLANQINNLTSGSRRLLLGLLRESDNPHEHYNELDNAFVATQRIRLNYFLRQHKSEIDTVCDMIGDVLTGLQDRRQRHAVLCAIIDAAAKVLLSDGLSVNAKSLLHTLIAHNWNSLLDLSYPGYGMKLVGEVLCGQALTTRVSSPPTE